MNGSAGGKPLNQARAYAVFPFNEAAFLPCQTAYILLFLYAEIGPLWAGWPGEGGKSGRSVRVFSPNSRQFGRGLCRTERCFSAFPDSPGDSLNQPGRVLPLSSSRARP